ncbi:T9SS type A sorting domain-containing protein [Crocinitomicaceae bacterium]|nr:T9SS type A sorting domain-containing protein [Crocinitomicaceae bacterium]MDA9274992.1 T9SS type A sorting domain-containing protein [Crocinitomicaceae bacterium]MDB4075056.1 T9SS type A sorting domain-containing protein [Crocinitomicaceae bacterium]MDC1282587.1 T9SS type A sorting domain-containing protein [Crocinitomicaceae bacterium]
MKNLLLFGALALSLNSLGQEVVSTQGDSYTNANGSIDFTIGEVVINTVTDGTNDLTQGFHQTNWNFLGVDNHEQNFEATVYPNPTNGKLTIDFAGIIKNVEVVDMLGRRVLAPAAIGNKSVDATGLSTGKYMARITTDTNQILVKEFVVQK